MGGYVYHMHMPLCEIYGSIYRMRNVAGRIPMAKNRQSSEEGKAARGVTTQAGNAERGAEMRGLQNYPTPLLLHFSPHESRICF